MANWKSTEAWKPVEADAVRELLGSNQTFSLERKYWPHWAQDSTQMERIWVYCPDHEHPGTLSNSTVAVVARLLTERFDLSDDPLPYNYNFYLYTQSTGGELFQSPPIKTKRPRHHSSEPPGWLDEYGPSPMSSSST